MKAGQALRMAILATVGSGEVLMHGAERGCVDVRQVLFLQGGVQMMVSEIIVAVLLAVQFNAHNGEAINKSIGAAVIFFICLFVAGFGESACSPAWHVSEAPWIRARRACGPQLT